MQIKINLTPSAPLAVPMNYGYQLQSAIYSKLGEVGASDFIHDTGYGGARKYKAFVFGKLSGKYTVMNKQLVFADTISFEVRSPDFKLCDNLQRSLEINPVFKFFNTPLPVSDIRVTNTHITESIVIFTSDGGVVAHTTLDNGKTIYFSPEGEEFFDRLEDNFKSKYKAFTGREAGGITILPHGKYRKTVTNYKGLWINSYSGRFKVIGKTEYIEFIYNAGLGEKNSQGFGLMNI